MTGKKTRKKYYERHREEVYAYNKAYQATHPEKMKAYKKAYRLAHREEIKASAKAYHATHREERKAYWRRHHYGMTTEEWIALMNEQGGFCAIQGCTKPCQVIDHDHKTGKVRGLLCVRHNLALSYIEDGESLLLLRYLNRGEVR